MIYLECYADEALVKGLGVSSGGLKHAFSKGEVCNMLRKSTQSIGIVDEDPGSGKPAYEKLMLNHKIIENDCLIFCKEKSSGNRLVILRPKLELLIVSLSKKNKLDLQKYNLSTNTNRLHDELALKRNYQKLNSLTEVTKNLLSTDNLIKELKEFIF